MSGVHRRLQHPRARADQVEGEALRGAGQDVDQAGGQVNKFQNTKHTWMISDGNSCDIFLTFRNCVDALRFLGEAGKCRKLDSQVKEVSFGSESDVCPTTRITMTLVTGEA